MRFDKYKRYIDVFGFGFAVQFNQLRRNISIGCQLGFYRYFFLLEFPRSAEEE